MQREDDERRMDVECSFVIHDGISTEFLSQ
jgi:hypothetical protein